MSSEFRQQEALVPSLHANSNNQDSPPQVVSSPHVGLPPKAASFDPPRRAAAFPERERRGLLALADALVLLGATFAAHAVRVGPGADTGLVALATAAVGVATLYAQDEYGLGRQSWRAATIGVAAGVAGALPIALALQGAPSALAGSALAGIGAAMGIGAVRQFSGRWFTKASARKAFMVGTADEVTRAWGELARYPLSGLTPAASLEDADCLIVGRSALDMRGVRDRAPAGVEIVDVSTLFERLGRRLPADLLDERWFLERFTMERGIGFHVGKRAMDILASLTGLALALPLLPAIALAIWLEDRGPIFYGQVRVGKDGRPFTIYKLRSMRIDAENGGAVWALKNDDRVTRMGRFLRKSRLDEVPQLFNVLRGDMSLVGPRPERPEFVASLEKEIPFYAHRHRVQPGLTGWAQVRYPYGASVEDAAQKLAYDLYYMKHRSLLFDLAIAWRTVGVVIGRVGSR